jgi:hypothetical protein
MKKFKCPVCGSSLSKQHFQTALGIVEAQQKAIRDDRLQLARERDQLKQRVTEAKVLAEKKSLEKIQRLVHGKDKLIETLKQTVRQLKRGTTPQSEGLEFEENLTRRLRKEFPSDNVEHKGTSGDILHTVIDAEEKCGTIVYELKRTKIVQLDHVKQAARARIERAADVAILVTTGTARGFNGFSSFNGVPVVAPQGVIALVKILRGHLIQIQRANLTSEQRQIAARKVIEYLTGPQFRNHLENIIQIAKELQCMVKAETKTHMKTWENRWLRYESMIWDSTQIRADLALVLQGKEPQLLRQPRPRAPLLLE